MICAADLIKYNANNAGNSVGDCVKRACSIAFNMPYHQVNKEMAAIVRKSGYEGIDYSHPFVFNRFFESKGLPLRPVEVPLDSRVTLTEFADSHDRGTWIVLVGKYKDKQSTHMVAIVDGVVYDSWDSRDWYVYSYRNVLGAASISVNREFVMSDHEDEIIQWTREAVDKMLNKYESIHSLTGDDYVIKTSFSSRYNGKVSVRLCLKLPSFNNYMSLIFALVIPPSSSNEEALALMHKTISTRVYDRFYELAKKIPSLVGAESDSLIWKYDANSLEGKFLRSLPPEIANAICQIFIGRPGRSRLSYGVSLNGIHLYGRTADELRKKLEIGQSIGWDKEAIEDEFYSM